MASGRAGLNHLYFHGKKSSRADLGKEELPSEGLAAKDALRGALWERGCSWQVPLFPPPFLHLSCPPSPGLVNTPKAIGPSSAATDLLPSEDSSPLLVLPHGSHFPYLNLHYEFQQVLKDSLSIPQFYSLMPLHPEHWLKRR